jgi:hypothetical protein
MVEGGSRPVTSSTAETLLRQNLSEVFGEHDADRRQAAIARIFTADAQFIDPEGSHEGHAAIHEAAGQLLAKFPDFVFTERGRAEAHNGIGRLAWGFGPPDSAPAVTGLDVIVTAEGKIKALYTFLDPAAG